MNFNKFKYLSSIIKPAREAIGVVVLGTCLILSQSIFSQTDHERDPIGRGGPRPKGAGSVRESTDTCGANPQRLADFANGNNYDFGNMVAYLTQPACISNGRSIRRSAIAAGVSFAQTGPYRLDLFARGVNSGGLQTEPSTEAALANSIPALLRSEPLGNAEMLPVLGQVALLSPKAARMILTQVIRQEISDADRRMNTRGAGNEKMVAEELSRVLVRMGSAESAIASDLADSVEELAMMSQSESLASYFRGLGAAAAVEVQLIPTFNLSASALSRGIRKNVDVYSADERDAMLVATFAGSQSTVLGGAAMEPGAADFNEAVAALLAGKKLSTTSLRALWRQAASLLSQSAVQPALAEAIADSLTPQLLYLSPRDRDLLLGASRNYVSLARAVQREFLKGWLELRKATMAGLVKPAVFNRTRTQYFDPMVAGILDLEPSLIDSVWLEYAVAHGLISDEAIEKKFPRIVLSMLNRRSQATRTSLGEAGLEPTVASFSENFAVLYGLSRLHLPVLARWVKKYEQ